MALWDLASWDWVTLGKIVVGAGLGTAIVQGAITIVRERRDRRSQAAYLALRSAIELELFAVRCFDTTGKIYMFGEAGLRPGEQTVGVPNVPAFPDDNAGWRAIDIKLAEEVLTFPTQVLSAQHFIDFSANVGGPAEEEEKIKEHCALLGAHAKRLANKLRIRYAYPEFKFEGEDFLFKQAMVAEERKNSRQL